MDAYVQFIRNALCTAKNFHFLGDTFLYDPKVTAMYYDLPSPLDQTTPLEVIIAATQLYAFFSVSLAGYRMLTKSGVGKLQLINRLVNLRSSDAAADDEGKGKDKKNDDGDKKDEDEKKIEDKARELVTKSLLDESDAATRSFFVGTNVLVVGLSFFWLFASSFHVTSTDWIGGLVGLIHALEVMEIGLLVFLYYMVKDAGAAGKKANRMKIFAATLTFTCPKNMSVDIIETLTVEQYNWLVDGWESFWAEGSSASVETEGKILTKEEEAVASNLRSFSKKMNQEIPDRIRAQARIALFEGFREYVYLVLNFFAFYGYLTCIIVFYYEDESAQPDYIRTMLFKMSNGDADWLGNAVGDFMWTVEPIVILGSPMIINSMIPKKKTTKEKVA